MANWHGYLLIDELPPGWTNEQRLTVRNSMHGLGLQAGTQPPLINHYVVSPDNVSMIFEALFTDAEITDDAVFAMLAIALSLPEAAVRAVVTYSIFAEDGTWEESKALAQAYIIDNGWWS